MAIHFDGSTQYASNNNAPVTGPPFAASLWINSDMTSGSNLRALHIGDKDSASFLVDHMWIALNSSGYMTASTEGYDAVTTSTISADTWYHVAGIWATSSDRRCLLDGGSKGTNTTTRAVANIDTITIGARNVASITAHWDGMLAEIAVWDLSSWPGGTDTLRADGWENNVVPALASGITPLAFPLGLVRYYPLMNNATPSREFMGGFGATVFNTPSTTVHPRVFSVPVPWYMGKATAPAGGLSIPVAMRSYRNRRVA